MAHGPQRRHAHRPVDRAGRRPGHAGRPQGEARASRPARRSTATRSTAPPPARRSPRSRASSSRCGWSNASVPAGVVAALARRGGARRHGRHRGRHAGRGAAGRRVRLPVPGHPRRARSGTTPTRSPTSRSNGGLFGALVDHPAHAAPPAWTPSRSCTSTRAAAPSTAGRATCPSRRRRAPRVRVRVVNTDAGPMRVWPTGGDSGSSPSTAARCTGPPRCATRRWRSPRAGGPTWRSSRPPAGGGVRVEIGGTLGDRARHATRRRPRCPRRTVDMLTYGAPAPLGFDPAAADRRFDYAIGRSFGFIDGLPGLWWTVNGHLYPDVPMYVVRAGDVVTMHISNSSGEVHPMHLHGHHAVVLARNGIARDRQPVVVRLPQRRERRVLRHRVRRGQPGRLDGSLPPAQARRRRPRRPPDVRGDRHARTSSVDRPGIRPSRTRVDREHAWCERIAPRRRHTHRRPLLHRRHPRCRRGRRRPRRP